jgi:two-component system sensor histidine kinase DegS
MEQAEIAANPDELFQGIQNELEHSKNSYSEVTLMLEQSRAEISKLTQRNAAITVHLQQIHEQFETIPRADIRMTYDAALDAQHRLLIMRGQLEKLQADQASLLHYTTFLDNILLSLKEINSGNNPGIVNSTSSMMEMQIVAQEVERQRLSRQMHDGPAQTLSNFIVQADIAARYLDLDPVKAKEELNNLKLSAMATFKKVRDFIFELRPMMLDDLGLFPTIDRYAQSCKDQYGIDINLTVNGKEKRLDSFIEVFIFRTLQELIGNAARHNLDSLNRIIIKIQVHVDDTNIRVSVSDNGKGFDPQSLFKERGIGLKLIRERLDMLGGSLEINTTPGQGCRVSFQIPVITSMAA